MTKINNEHLESILKDNETNSYYSPHAVIHLYSSYRYLKEKNKEQILKNALSLLYYFSNKQESNGSYSDINPFSLESLLPDIETVPDGSLGGGSDVYGGAWTVLGVFIPSQNKIKLVSSAGQNVLNHELGHWYAHVMQMPQPTRQVAEHLAEKHKYDGRNLFENIKHKNSETRYFKKAA